MDVALVVGGAFLSGFFQVAIDHLTSSRNFLDFIHRKHQVEFDEETLDRLQISLMSLSVVLEDAEAKQTKYSGVGTWLDKLKSAMHEADDLLDELNTECMLLKLHAHFQLTDANMALNSNFIQELIPSLKKISARMEYFVKQSQVLCLHKFDPNEKVPYKAPSSSVVDKSQIFCRTNEREELIQRMLFDEEQVALDVCVIAITGMGGIGKTTLAQLVYNDERVKEKFTTRACVCVSEYYDVVRVTKALLMEFNSAV